MNSFHTLFTKSFCVSLLLGGIPAVIIYVTEPTKDGIIKKALSLFPDETLQFYFIIGYTFFLILSAFLGIFWLRSRHAEGLLVFLRNVFQETASGLRNLMQTIAGVILVSCLFWYLIEPQTFSSPLLYLFLIIGIILLVFSSILERIENILS